MIRGILHRFSPLVEPLSLDEAYLDVSAHPGAPDALAEVIRALIFRKTKLTASAGIGPNKLIAKIASDLNKPNGQCEVTPEQVPEFMAVLPVRKLWGIGQVTEQKLERLGVTTCAHLQRFFAGGTLRALWEIRSRTLRSMPRDRRPPGRTGSRTKIAQQRGDLRQRSRNAGGMRGKATAIVRRTDGGAGPEGRRARGDEDFCEAEVQRFHPDHGGTRGVAVLCWRICDCCSPRDSRAPTSRYACWAWGCVLPRAKWPKHNSRCCERSGDTLVARGKRGDRSVAFRSGNHEPLFASSTA